MGSRVTPGIGSVMALRFRRKRLNSVDLPTLGLPAMTTQGNFFSEIDSKSVIVFCPEIFIDLGSIVHLHNFGNCLLGLGEEHISYDLLDDRGELDAETVAQIGDITQVEAWLDEVITARDVILASKAEDIAPSAEKSLNGYIASLRERMNKHLETLSTNDRENLEKQRRDMQSIIHNVQAKVEEYFGTMSVKMDEAKIAILRDLRRSSHEHSQLQDKTGTETKIIKTRVSDSRWYNPFSWGKSHTEISSYQTTYTYVDTSDALESIRHYANDASSSIEQGFVETTDVQSLKQHLLKVVVENFDASDENYDPAYFRLLTERTLNKIDMPVMKIDVEEYLSTLSAQFSGEIRDSSKRSELRNILSASISKLALRANWIKSKTASARNC